MSSRRTASRPSHGLLVVAACGTLPACAAEPWEAESSDERDEDLTIAGLDAGAAGGLGRGRPVGVVESAGLVDREFYVRGLGSRCWDVGAQGAWEVGAPVFLSTCNGSPGQRIRVVELDAESHDVELRVAATPFCIGVRDGVDVAHPLELQVCSALAPPRGRDEAAWGPWRQRFALDGDSVMVGVQRGGRVRRDFVIEAWNGETGERTPLVVGERDASDAEYFRMAAVDGSDSVPTSGFVRVGVYHGPDVCRVHRPANVRCTPPDHWLDVVTRTRGWGTVIEIDDREEFPISEPRNLPAGTTLRGSRRQRSEGPTVTYTAPSGSALWVDQDRVRITGLRFVGPGTDQPGAAGALALYSDRLDPSGQHTQRILVDHVEITNWTGAAVAVSGDDENVDESDPRQPQARCDVPARAAHPRPTPVQVLRSFIHDNSRTSGGYGIGAGKGAFVRAQGNVLYKNQHSLTSDPWRRSGFVAYDNLVLSPTFGSPRESNQDFDIHGSGGAGPGGSFSGGIAGDYFDVGWNTFLQERHFNFKQRGTPCRFSLFHDNLAAGVLLFTTQSEGPLLYSAPPEPIPEARQTFAWGNRGGVSDLLGQLAAGDFDGDHIDDVFVGTGVTWWLSSGGRTEWRLLNRMTEHANELRFGDFDGDGRTDVLAVHDGNVDVSWAGISPWRRVNHVGGGIVDLAVGDFDGDHVSDLFYADGNEWSIAPGARAWQPPFAASRYHTRDLRFGDFTGDGRTDVLGVVEGQWKIVRAGTEAWHPLRAALTTNLDDVVVADFDGDGLADVARSASGVWQYSPAGTGPFVPLRRFSQRLDRLPVGDFDGERGADVIVWMDDSFGLAPGPRQPVARHALHPMR